MVWPSKLREIEIYGPTNMGDLYPRQKEVKMVPLLLKPSFFTQECIDVIESMIFIKYDAAISVSCKPMA